MNHLADAPSGISTSAPATGTLQRWLTGPRVSSLPQGSAMPVPALSFEFFPPRTEALEQQLWSCIRRLEPLAPRFVSVTYGAGGSTQERTHATVARLVRETALTPAAHLTCVGASRGEVDDVARRYWEAGVRHIVALRGDLLVLIRRRAERLASVVDLLVVRFFLVLIPSRHVTENGHPHLDEGVLHQSDRFNGRNCVVLVVLDGLPQ